MTNSGELLRSLAELEAPEGTGIVSVYLDSRAEATGNRPAERKADTIIKDRLNQIEKSLLPRGAGLDSFRADRPRIERAIEELGPQADGLAIFACDALGVFETYAAGTPFRTRVAFGPHAAVYQLARLSDEFEPAVVALVDTNTVRLFTVHSGKITEAAGRDDDDFPYRMRKIGGMHEARYRRHVEKNRADFAADVAKLVTELIESEGATRLIIAGDAVAIPLLRDALPSTALERLVGPPISFDIRASRDDVGAGVEAILDEAEAEASASVVDILVEEVMQDDLGVADVEPVRRAFAEGAVDTLVLLEDYGTAELRDGLTRLAVQTGAKVEFVGESAALQRLGGMGAILRWRPAI